MIVGIDEYENDVTSLKVPVNGLEDTAGSTGTRIERQGDFLKVQVNQRVGLKDGNVIHLGRASIQFVVPER